MPDQLRPEELVTLKILHQKGQFNVQITRTLRVTEGAVRYHPRRQQAGATEARCDRSQRAQPLKAVIDHRIDQADPRRPLDAPAERVVNVRALHDHLVAEHGYAGSYRSVLRFIRDRYLAPQLRPYRRVETPPGAQAQVDWGEVSGLDIGEGPQTLYAFVMVHSHCRKAVVVWRRRIANWPGITTRQGVPTPRRRVMPGNVLTTLVMPEYGSF